MRGTLGMLVVLLGPILAAAGPGVPPAKPSGAKARALTCDPNYAPKVGDRAVLYSPDSELVPFDLWCATTSKACREHMKLLLLDKPNGYDGSSDADRIVYLEPKTEIQLVAREDLEIDTGDGDRHLACTCFAIVVLSGPSKGKTLYTMDFHVARLIEAAKGTRGAKRDGAGGPGPSDLSFPLPPVGKAKARARAKPQVAGPAASPALATQPPAAAAAKPPASEREESPVKPTVPMPPSPSLPDGTATAGAGAGRDTPVAPLPDLSARRPAAEPAAPPPDVPVDRPRPGPDAPRPAAGPAVPPRPSGEIPSDPPPVPVTQAPPTVESTPAPVPARSQPPAEPPPELATPRPEVESTTAPALDRREGPEAAPAPDLESPKPAATTTATPGVRGSVPADPGPGSRLADPRAPIEATSTPALSPGALPAVPPPTLVPPQAPVEPATAPAATRRDTPDDRPSPGLAAPPTPVATMPPPVRPSGGLVPPAHRATDLSGPPPRSNARTTSMPPGPAPPASPPPLSPAGMFAAAWTAEQEGKPLEALANYRALTKAHPSSPESRRAAARIGGLTEKLEIDAQEARAAFVLKRARDLEASGNAALALTYYSQIVKVYPKTPSARIAAAKIKLLGG